MNDEIMDLFADSSDLILNGAEGGKKELREFFESLKNLSQNPEFLHQAVQLSGIVDINPDGETPEGRWYGLGAVVLPAPFHFKHPVTGKTTNEAKYTEAMKQRRAVKPEEQK